MMSDDDPTDPHLEDRKASQQRRRYFLAGGLLFSVAAIAAIVVSLFVVERDSQSQPTPIDIVAPTQAPSSVALIPIPPTPAPIPIRPESQSPTLAPTTSRLEQLINAFLVPVSGEEVFQDRRSPQYRAAEFLADFDNVAGALSTTKQLGDRYALATFYYAMDGDDSWFSCYQGDEECKTGIAWLDPNIDHCQWSAIRCNSEGRVVDVFWTTSEGNGLVGSIPPEFALLTELQNFVAVNNLIGGNLPESFGEMTNLIRVVLTTNVITGTIPEGFLVNSPLQIFDVSNNQISGAIPRSFGNISTLTRLVLANNRFSDTIPSEMGDLELLGTLDLADNDRLRGSIPQALYGLVNLESLYLNGCTSIQGELSTAISRLSSLRRLRLGGTGISGFLPDGIFSLNNIEEIDLSGAAFSGPLSEDFSQLAGSIRTLRLSNNFFFGNVPFAFDDLVFLNELELDGNDLTGEISENLCARRADSGIVSLTVLTVDCDQIFCNCCTNCR